MTISQSAPKIRNTQPSNITSIQTIGGGHFNNHALYRLMRKCNHPYLSTVNQTMENFSNGPRRHDILVQEYGVDCIYDVIFEQGEAAFKLNRSTESSKIDLTTPTVDNIMHAIHVITESGFIHYMVTNGCVKFHGEYKRSEWVRSCLNECDDNFRLWVISEGTDGYIKAGVVGDALELLSYLSVKEDVEGRWSIGYRQDRFNGDYTHIHTLYRTKTFDLLNKLERAILTNDTRLINRDTILEFDISDNANY